MFSDLIASFLVALVVRQSARERGVSDHQFLVARDVTFWPRGYVSVTFEYFEYGPEFGYESRVQHA